MTTIPDFSIVLLYVHVNVLSCNSRDLLATLFISVAVCTSKTFDLANDNNVILLAISPYGHSGMTFLVSKQSKALRCLLKKEYTLVFLINLYFHIMISNLFRRLFKRAFFEEFLMKSSF